MRSYRRVCSWLLLLLLLLLQDSAPVAAQRGGGAPSWLTLSGNEPTVIAKGGFSGLFPESSSMAYAFANQLGLPNVIFWCDVQLTNDSVGICLPDVNLANCTDIALPYSPYNNMSRDYIVNGRPVRGWFPVDYNYKQLYNNVFLIRSILSRPPNYDSNYRILTVEDAGNFSQSLWLNIQHDLFYKQHNLNMTKYVLAVSRSVPVAYISSPEIVFLRNIAATFKETETKLIFRFPEENNTEPSTNRTYDSLLMNLSYIKTFASGILIPKNYIWPVTSGPDPFLFPSMSIVTDAHKFNLEVFASGFANDALIAYNYSYSPVSEYLNFIDNGKFSVDGFLSDFPSTAYEAIGCFSHLGSNTSRSKTPLIITHHGDSGDFPSCTDLAYNKAIVGGADVIDCSVQVTKDGNLICLESIDLISSTTISKSKFSTRFSYIPEIQSKLGIFSFNFTWEEIQKNLRPEISNPWLEGYALKRNTANKNAGEFMSLAQFLLFAKDKNLTGVLINVENAHFLVEKLGFDIIGSVIKAVSDAGYNNKTNIKVMIKSSNSSTLIPFRQKTQYKIVYQLDELVSDTDSMSLKDIKKFADAVAIRKSAIFPNSNAFITRQTKLVETLHSAKLEVYVYVLMNEFISTPWDFFGDAIMEIHNFIAGADVNGVITDFPATSALYRRNTCSKSNFSIPLVQPGFLIDAQQMTFLPPAQAPYPLLKDSDVSEPALPPVKQLIVKPTSPPPSGSPNSQPRTVPSLLVCLTTLAGFLLFIK